MEQGTTLALLATSLLLGASHALAQSGSFAITDVRLFDGEAVHPQVTVVVEDGRITSVGTADIDNLPRIDGAGASLLPGLLDAHTHTDEVAQLRESLRFGVTTILDMGTFPPGEPVLRAAARSRTDVSDFRSAGILATAPGGHGTEAGISIPTVAGPEDAAGFVAARVADGADYLKLVINGVRHARSGMPTLNAATVQALVTVAHDHGLMALAHIESVDDARLAIDAGVDGFVHGWRDSGSQPELSRAIAARGIFVMPTLTAVDALSGEGPRTLLADERITPYLSSLSKQVLAKETRLPPGVRIEVGYAALQSLIDAKVMLLAGSDAWAHAIQPPLVHGASLHRHLELFVVAGLSPTEALRSATANVADAFNLTDRGRIQPGLRADLLLVRGDPTTDITATRDIVKVWREGHEFDRSKRP